MIRDATKPVVEALRYWNACQVESSNKSLIL